MKIDFKNPRQQRILTVITVILVIAAGIIASYFRAEDEESGYLVFHNEGYLSIMDASGAVTDVYYSDMTDITFYDNVDFGSENGGTILEDAYRLGRWNSPQLGSYLNCTKTNVAACIRIRTQQDTYLINLESDSATKALYQAILKAKDGLKG